MPRHQVIINDVRPNQARKSTRVSAACRDLLPSVSSMSSDDEYEECIDDFQPGTSIRAANLKKEPSDYESVVKKRKLSRACDICRKRKVRCDFVELPSGDLQKCLNCFSSKLECTFSEDIKPRKTSKNYIQKLEKKVERSERLLKLLCPDSELREELLNGDVHTPLPSAPGFKSDRAPRDELVSMFAKASGKSPVDLTVLGIRLQMFRRYPEHDQHERCDSEEDAEEDEHLSRVSYHKLRTEPKESDHFEGFFLGKSSARNFVARVIALKERSRESSSHPSPSTVDTSTASSDAESEPSDQASGLDIPLRNFSDNGSNAATSDADRWWKKRVECEKSFWGERRAHFWSRLPWEDRIFKHSQEQNRLADSYTFPEDVLLHHLINLYFKHINLELPLLHRPTLERGISSGLHKSDVGFCAVLLLVCAIGARYSDDPLLRTSNADVLRAYEIRHGQSKISTNIKPEHYKAIADRSKGWNFFEQAWAAMDPHFFLVPPTLYDLQFYCLATEYLMGSTIPHPMWLLTGIGIRLAQEVGAHRRKWKTHYPLEHQLACQDELWKRACWVLIAIDRFTSAGTGRPCALQEEDFDLELPIECDDEYWDNPNPALRFKQPSDKPSLVSAFSVAIRLNQIMYICLRTIYCLDYAKLTVMKSEQWKPRVVAEIDSALNKWLDALPSHLRWDPEHPNDDFFAQSAMLHTSYYHLQILTHRPFIPRPNQKALLPVPSMAICANAARNIINIGQRQLERTGDLCTHMPICLLSAGIITLMKTWEAKKAGKLTEQAHKRDMDDFNTCLRVLKSTEKRWYMSGKLWDLLNGIANAKSGPPEERATAAETSDALSGLNSRLREESTSNGKAKQADVSTSFASTSMTSDNFGPSPFTVTSLDVKNEESVQMNAAICPSPFVVGPSSLPTNPASGPPQPTLPHMRGAYADGGAFAHASSSSSGPSQPPQSEWSMFVSSPRTPQQSAQLRDLHQERDAESTVLSSEMAMALGLGYPPGSSNADPTLGDPQQDTFPLLGGNQDGMVGNWDLNLAPWIRFPFGVGTEQVRDPAFEMDAALSQGSNMGWQAEPMSAENAQFGDDWGTYLTGIADLTSRYDIDYVFPSPSGSGS